MSKLIFRMWRSPRLLRVLFAVSAPVMVTVFFAPLWAIILSMTVALSCAVFIYAEVLSPKFVHQGRKDSNAEAAPTTDGASVASGNAKKGKGQNVSAKSRQVSGSGLARALDQTETYPSEHASNQAASDNALASYASKAQANCKSAQQEIRSVINLSTHAALLLGQSIREIERNHDTQSHLAKNLLKSTSSEQSGQGQESLSDLASVASAILERQNTQLIETAENASRLIEKQKSAMLIASRADDLLGEADNAARQLALNVMGSSINQEQQPNSKANDAKASDGTEATRTIDPWSFVQSHRQTLKELRTDLEQIRMALSQVTLNMQSNVNSLRHVAIKESTAVAKVNESIQKKLEETQGTVNALTVLSADTESHIQASIIAMQYHDIMTQKLSAIDTLHLEAMVLRNQSYTNALPGLFIQDSLEVHSPKLPEEKHVAHEHKNSAVNINTSNEVDLFV